MSTNRCREKCKHYTVLFPSDSKCMYISRALYSLLPRVEKNRKEDDTGEYWCLARNSHGTAVSKKAKLEIACKFRWSIYRPNPDKYLLFIYSFFLGDPKSIFYCISTVFRCVGLSRLNKYAMSNPAQVCLFWTCTSILCLPLYKLAKSVCHVWPCKTVPCVGLSWLFNPRFPGLKFRHRHAVARICDQQFWFSLIYICIDDDIIPHCKFKIGA